MQQNAPNQPLRTLLAILWLIWTVNTIASLRAYCGLLGTRAGYQISLHLEIAALEQNIIHLPEEMAFWDSVKSCADAEEVRLSLQEYRINNGPAPEIS